MNNAASTGGRIGSAVFGLAFAGFGVVFIGFAVFALLSESSVQGWPEVRARIISSEVVPATGADGGFNAVIRFEILSDGETIAGQHQEHDASYKAMLEIVRRHLPGETIVLRQNPAKKSEIKPTPKQGGPSRFIIVPFLLIPLVFVAIGGSMVWAAFSRGAGPESSPRAISDKMSGRRAERLGHAIGLIIGLTFTLVGGGATWFVGIKPAVKILEARMWTETPATVEVSRVVSTRGSKGGRTYRPEILFRYAVSGQTYRSSDVSFFTGSSSGRDSKEQMVRRHPVGGSATAFVNPRNPSEAVLDRSFSPVVFFGLFTLLFFVIGAGLLIYFVRRWRAPSDASPISTAAFRVQPRAIVSNASADPTDTDGSVTLKPATSRATKIIAMLLVSLFWNGIVSVFIFQFVKTVQQGRPEWFLGGVLIPFVLIGLGLIIVFAMQILALTNPKPRLEITPGRPRAGGRFHVRWSFTGAVARMDRLRLTLVGIESATYSRGTSTSTDTSAFSRMEILDTVDHTTMRAGEIEIAIPQDAAPSFTATRNRLQWSVVVAGEIARWPDVDDEFPVTLLAGDGSAEVFHEGLADQELLESAGFRLGLRGGRRSFRPGESVEGVAAWSLDAAPRSAEVRLFWFTEGKGTTDVGVIHTETFSAMHAQDARPFRFDLPEGPLSIDGRLVSVKWAIEFIADTGSETVLRWDLVVSPTGRPLTLQAVTVDPKRKKSSFRFARS